MGSYLNPGSKKYERCFNSEIYVDKSGLIAETNKVINTIQPYVCVSRPRRFGKSVAMDMLAAYYSKGADSKGVFENLKIAKDRSFTKHLNGYNVIKINMQQFLSPAKSVDDLIEMLKKRLLFDLLAANKDVEFFDSSDFIEVLKDVYSQTGYAFVILIDEWDCIFREYKEDTESQRKYLDFLRFWLKDQEYVALAYMTGILPIKKYGTHSALNMFTEYSMVEPRGMAPYFGFTEQEVQDLCEEYNMSFEEAKAWYDGYELTDGSVENPVRYSMYSPKSMVDAMLARYYSSYWNRTETYEALKIYIQLNMDGLKDAVVSMLAGESVVVNSGTFTNDMTTFSTRDDVLTLLIHLGYLSYDRDNHSVTIPNKEVSEEYLNCIRTMEGWSEVARAVQTSQKLLESLWDGDEEAVAHGVDLAHEEISILQYNDENSLSCCIHLAFYYAREYYTIIRELPAGKGFADVVYIPHTYYPGKPAVIIELKWDKNADGAINQIKEKRYTGALKGYSGDTLLCGINYDKATKKHQCVIEKITMDE